MENIKQAGQGSPNESPQLDKDKEENDGHHKQKKTFVCPYCFKEFSCSRALGGHLNSHREEKFEARREKRLLKNAKKKPVKIAPAPSPAFSTNSGGNSSEVLPPNPSLLGQQTVNKSNDSFWNKFERTFRPQRHMVIPYLAPPMGPPELIFVADDSTESNEVKHMDELGLRKRSPGFEEDSVSSGGSPSLDLNLSLGPAKSMKIDLALKL